MLWWLSSAWADETIRDRFLAPLPFAPPDEFRLVLDQRVELPAALWFTSDFNRQARVLRYHLGLVLDCRTHTWTSDVSLDCRAIDAAISADAFEDGLLQPILDEVDAKLTGARVTVGMTPDGRVAEVDLDEASVRPQTNRRINLMHENLRLMVRKAVLGLELPQDHQASVEVWPSRRTDLLQSVSSSGTGGRVSMVHSLSPVPDDDRWLIRSTGDGIGAPALGDILLPYRVQIESIAVYDPKRAMLTERLWTVSGVPTPSNPLADGFPGLPIRVESSMRVVGRADPVELFPSIERTPVMGSAL